MPRNSLYAFTVSIVDLAILLVSKGQPSPGIREKHTGSERLEHGELVLDAQCLPAIHSAPEWGIGSPESGAPDTDGH